MTQRTRVETIQGLGYDQALKLIYEWVKTGVVNLRQFKELIQANRDSTT